MALCVGGGNDPLSEYDAAKQRCELAGKSTCAIVCNDMIALFPHVIDHAVTLHPDKMYGWVGLRTRNNYPALTRMWAHRSYEGFSDSTRDWQGSSGLFMVKVARTLGYTKIILCGVPMCVEGNHIVRHQPWNAAHGFARGWQRRIGELRPFVRSMSGWTMEQFGDPTPAWLAERNDAPPIKREDAGLKA